MYKESFGVVIIPKKTYKEEIEENLKKYGVEDRFKWTGKQWTQQPRGVSWWCTDEVCTWYGAPMRRKDTKKGDTGRKYSVWNMTDVLGRIRAAWKSGDILQGMGSAIFEESSKSNTGLNISEKGGLWFPELSTPKRDKGFIGKTQSQSKKKYQAECAKEWKKDNTPLGFVTAVNPTKAGQKKGKAGHVFAVNCDGDIVADTNIGFTRGKKIRKNNLITIQSWKNTSIAKRWEKSGYKGTPYRTVPKGRLRRFEKIFLKSPFDRTTKKRGKKRKDKEGVSIVERTFFADMNWRDTLDMRWD